MRERKVSSAEKEQKSEKTKQETPLEENVAIDYGHGITTPTEYKKIFPIALAMGLAFGFALEKGRVFEPHLIYDQMLMRKFQMMKMFLSAVATSMVVMILLFGFKTTANYFNYSRAYIFKAQRGWPIVILGAFLLGSGMSISGACPGTVVVQIGAGVEQSIYVILGGLLAAGLYSYFEYKVRGFVSMSCPKVPHCTLDTSLRTSYTKMALPLLLALISFVVVLEYIFPWQSQLNGSDEKQIQFELQSNGNIFQILQMKAWPPYVAGMVVGSLQIPAILLLRVSLGSASSYATVSILLLSLVNKKIVERSEYMKALSTGIALWQPTYLFGAMLGAFLSSSLSNSWHTVESFSPLRAFLGGFLLLLGSRLSGGCTSGHGISGFAYLASISLIAVPVMFAGGIGTAVVMHGFGF
jgi:uncharacterized membrane protein YedE/YeeE